MDGSPLHPSPGRCPPRPKLPLSQCSNNTAPKYNNRRPQRNGHPSNPHRGSARLYQTPCYPENLNLPPRTGFPIPPLLLNGVSYETHPPYFPPPFAPPPPPPTNHGFDVPPFIVSSQPRYMNSPQHQGTFMPTINNSPFVVGTHTPYGGPTPPYYGGPYIPGPEYFTPPFTIQSQQGEYMNQPQYNGFYTPNMGPPTPLHDSRNQCYATPSALSDNREVTTASVKEPEVVEEETVGIDLLLNSKRLEKAPKLIRIYDSESEANSGEDDASETETEKLSQQRPVSDAVKNVQDGSEVPGAESDVGSEVSYICKTGKENSSNSSDHASDSGTKGTSASLVQCRSHSPPRFRESIQASFQPKTGISVEQYVRRAAVKSGYKFNENALADVIRCLEDERKKDSGVKDETVVKEKGKVSCRVVESQANSRDCSLSRSCSSRSG